MSQYNHPVPTSFLLDEENRQLILSWSDEHESIHGWEALRWACPCAWCAGEGGQPGMLQSKQSLNTEETTLVDIQPDRKSTRLNSSHVSISYAVFCLKKKK